MNTLCVVFFVGIVAAAQASLIGLGAGAVDGAAVLTGPSGIVTRTGLGIGIAGPAAIAAPALGLGLGLGLGVTSQDAAQLALQLSVPAGSGLEGQYIPDINEKLYDDGAYRPLVHGL